MLSGEARDRAELREHARYGLAVAGGGPCFAASDSAAALDLHVDDASFLDDPAGDAKRSPQRKALFMTS
jgi:hypothetical protein